MHPFAPFFATHPALHVSARRRSLLSAGGLTLLALPVISHSAPTDDPTDAANVLRSPSVATRGLTDVPATAQAAIGQIIVLGNKTLSQPAIILMTGHKVGDACTQQVLDEMRANLIKMGYFGLHSAELEDSVKITTEPGATPVSRCKVIITVDENDLIGGVIVQGAGPIKVEEIVSLLHLKRGAIYNPLQFRHDYEAIQDLYNRRGYTVTPREEAGFDEQGNLNVLLNVARVTDIQVIGNRKTRPRVILREMKTRKNDYFNIHTLEQDDLNLRNLGLFQEVTLVPRNLGNGQIGVTVTVKEKQYGTINGGGSYGAAEGLVGDVTLADHNFRGLGETISLTGELGATTGRHSVIFDYRKPWLDSHRTNLDLKLYDRAVYHFADGLYNATPVGTGSQGGQFIQQQRGGSVTLSRPLGQALSGALTLRGEDTTTDANGLSGINSTIVQDGPLYVLGSALQHDTRNLIDDATRGSYQNLNLSFGHADLRPGAGLASIDPSVFGSHNYGKSALDLRMFWSPFGAGHPVKSGEERTTMALRLLAGTSTGQMPFSEQYFLGGANTLRGYREDRFWGNNLFLSSVELRQAIARKFKVVAFMDVGEAWGGDYSNVNIAGFAQSAFQPHVGTGVGLRVGTPLGQVRLDFGYGDEGGRVHFGVGSSF